MHPYFNFLTNCTGFLAVTSVILVTLLQLSLNFCLQVCFAKCWYSIHLLHKLPKDWWRRVWWPLGTYKRRFYDIICIIFGRYIRNQGGSYQIFLWHLYFLQGGWGGCKFKEGICFILQNFNHAMSLNWSFSNDLTCYYSIFNEDKHTFVSYSLWGGRGHTHTSISLLALSPSLPPYFFPVVYLHTALHYLNKLILCKHAKCKRNLDSNFMCYLVFLPGFHTLGSTGPIENLKGGHEGEKRVTIFRYSQLNVFTGLSIR